MSFDDEDLGSLLERLASYSSHDKSQTNVTRDSDNYAGFKISDSTALARPSSSNPQSLRNQVVPPTSASPSESPTYFMLESEREAKFKELESKYNFKRDLKKQSNNDVTSSFNTGPPPKASVSTHLRKPSPIVTESLATAAQLGDDPSAVNRPPMDRYLKTASSLLEMKDITDDRLQNVLSVLGYNFDASDRRQLIASLTQDLADDSDRGLPASSVSDIHASNASEVLQHQHPQQQQYQRSMYSQQQSMYNLQQSRAQFPPAPHQFLSPFPPMGMPPFMGQQQSFYAYNDAGKQGLAMRNMFANSADGRGVETNYQMGRMGTGGEMFDRQSSASGVGVTEQGSKSTESEGAHMDWTKKQHEITSVTSSEAVKELGPDHPKQFRKRNNQAEQEVTTESAEASCSKKSKNESEPAVRPNYTSKEEFVQKERDNLLQILTKLRKDLEGQTKLCDANKEKYSTLSKELQKLKSQHDSLCRKLQKTKNGHNNPLLLENSSLQSSIKKKLDAMKLEHEPLEKDRKLLIYKIEKIEDCLDWKKTEDTKSHDKEKSSSKPDAKSRDNSDHKSATTKAVSKEKERRGVAKDAAGTTKDSAAPLEATSHGPSVNFHYYDPGSHWCKQCNATYVTALELLTHLHTADHKGTIDPYDRPWIVEESQKKSESLDGVNAVLKPYQGLEFLMPSSAIFCDLCHVFSGDEVCAEEHLKSKEHNDNYQKHLDKHPGYEQNLKVQKAAGLQMKSNKKFSEKPKDKKKHKEALLTLKNNVASMDKPKTKKVKLEMKAAREKEAKKKLAALSSKGDSSRADSDKTPSPADSKSLKPIGKGDKIPKLEVKITGQKRNVTVPAGIDLKSPRSTSSHEGGSSGVKGKSPSRRSSKEGAHSHSFSRNSNGKPAGASGFTSSKIANGIEGSHTGGTKFRKSISPNKHRATSGNQNESSYSGFGRFSPASSHSNQPGVSSSDNHSFGYSNKATDNSAVSRRNLAPFKKFTFQDAQQKVIMLCQAVDRAIQFKESDDDRRLLMQENKWEMIEARRRQNGRMKDRSPEPVKDERRIVTREYGRSGRSISPKRSPIRVHPKPLVMIKRGGPDYSRTSRYRGGSSSIRRSRSRSPDRYKDNRQRSRSRSRGHSHDKYGSRSSRRGRSGDRSSRYSHDHSSRSRSRSRDRSRSRGRSRSWDRDSRNRSAMDERRRETEAKSARLRRLEHCSNSKSRSRSPGKSVSISSEPTKKSVFERLGNAVGAGSKGGISKEPSTAANKDDSFVSEIDDDIFATPANVSEKATESQLSPVKTKSNAPVVSSFWAPRTVALNTPAGSGSPALSRKSNQAGGHEPATSSGMEITKASTRPTVSISSASLGRMISCESDVEVLLVKEGGSSTDGKASVNQEKPNTPKIDGKWADSSDEEERENVGSIVSEIREALSKESGGTGAEVSFEEMEVLEEA